MVDGIEIDKKDAQESLLPEDLNSLAQSSTPACRKVVDYLGRCISQMKSSLDGENIDIILSEFGCKFHALIFDHLQQFQYSSMGGMLAICDIKVNCLKNNHQNPK